MSYVGIKERYDRLHSEAKRSPGKQRAIVSAETREEILKAWALGESSAKIGHRFGFKSEKVRVIVNRARDRNDGRAIRRRDDCRTPERRQAEQRLDSGAALAFARESERRECTVSELRLMVLNRVASDNLFAAVLDE